MGAGTATVQTALVSRSVRGGPVKARMVDDPGLHPGVTCHDTCVLERQTELGS